MKSYFNQKKKRIQSDYYYCIDVAICMEEGISKYSNSLIDQFLLKAYNSSLLIYVWE